MKRIRIVLLTAVALLTTATISAQGRSYIRESIRSWDDCRNVAITKTNGDLALHGRNGYAVSDCPSRLVRTLDALNGQNKYIDDVVLTESGDWLVLYGDNGAIWSSIPRDLERQIINYQNAGEVINSISFNDDGDWVIVTDDRMATSNSTLMRWLKEGEDDYGELWTVFLNDDGAVAVYENGYYFRGNVPQELKDAVVESSLDCYRVKFAGTSYFFADKQGNYSYSM